MSDTDNPVQMSEDRTTALPVEEGWRRVLEPVAPAIHRMGDFLRAENAAGRGYLPAGTDVLRAFTYPFDEVKVLIVGQDPYPTQGHAMGLSFSTQPGVRPLPKSLANIFREYSEDLGFPMPVDGDLTPWSKQGVALFNRVLTVRPGAAASHRGKGWEEITEAAITALAERNRPLVAILWGRDAQNTQRFLGDTPCICSPHPSPLSAHRGFFGSRPFSRANEILTSQGAQPVDWRL
ncbi:uracil-DNA glycosylase [Corynebacterium sp. CCM 8863]|uniref:Uracil-DNA glycosylase n=1 Tax=Corynebacterium meridianum TaxID=2765363 RepID=A0A934I6M7_9CORY|nr:uracil-DNA glycosylase [Corynebacterium meridianum]